VLAPSLLAEEQEQYVVIASPDVAVSFLSRDELRRIFHFTKRFWKAGQPVTLLFSERSLEPGSFLLDEIYHLEYPQLRRLILTKLYQGEIDLAPKVVASERAILQFVASGHGLVALVERSWLDDGAAETVNVLSIDGKLPGSDGYPLQR